MTARPSDHGWTSVAAVTLGGAPSAWGAIGFEVGDGGFDVGGVWCSVDPSGERPPVTLVHATRTAPLVLDGMPIGVVPSAGTVTGEHPNTAIAIDHVVLATPSLARTRAALEAAGLPVRRERDAGSFRQAFLKVGGVVLEIVGPAGGPDASAEPLALWGVTFTVAALDAAVAAARAAGIAMPDPHDAVQPGRRIVAVPRAAGLPMPVALMTPAT